MLGKDSWRAPSPATVCTSTDPLRPPQGRKDLSPPRTTRDLCVGSGNVTILLLPPLERQGLWSEGVGGAGQGGRGDGGVEGLGPRGGPVEEWVGSALTEAARGPRSTGPARCYAGADTEENRRVDCPFRRRAPDGFPDARAPDSPLHYAPTGPGPGPSHVAARAPPPRGPSVEPSVPGIPTFILWGYSVMGPPGLSGTDSGGGEFSDLRPLPLRHFSPRSLPSFLSQ